MERQTVYLDGQGLTLAMLDGVVRGGAQIDLCKESWRLVERSREAISNMMQDPSRAVYGITTGFGSFANVSISVDNRKKLQLNLIRSHAIGVGNPVPLDTVRRMIVLRINTLAKGRSGIHPDNLRKFINAFNADFLPMIPEQGTVGASGDLAPLSHLALGMLGEGMAWDRERGAWAPAEGVLSRLGLSALRLEEKEGLALINGTQFMTSILTNTLSRAEALFDSALTLYALATELFGVDRELFSAESEEVYRSVNAELTGVISRVRELTGEVQSQLHRERVCAQEVHSLLDCPQALAGVRRCLDSCRRVVENEMNSATDNPLVYFTEDGFAEDTLVSAGNFHGEYVAKAADFLGTALFTLGKFSEARIERYVNGRVSRLCPFLIKNGGLNSGFMIAQYTTAALLSESKVLVKPASVDSIVTSAGQEDHVSMGGFAARKAAALLENMANIHAVELLMVFNAVQQLALQPAPALGGVLERLHGRVAPMVEDRYYAPDVAVAKELVLSGLTA